MTVTASRAGVPLGADLRAEGRPPVTGETAPRVAVADLTGAARFTGLEVLRNGARADFRQASLSYDSAGDGGASGSDLSPARGRVEGSGYGSSHDEVTGTVPDPRADTGLPGALIGER